jgi:hypothetical protein
MYKRTNNGVQPGFVDRNMDFCDVMDRNSTSHQFLKVIMRNFMPNNFAKIEKYWFTCPVAVRDVFFWDSGIVMVWKEGFFLLLDSMVY